LLERCLHASKLNLHTAYADARLPCVYFIVPMHAYCDPTRRYFLSRLGGSFGFVALDALMHEQSARAVEIDPVRPQMPRKPQFTPRAKSVIFLNMVGGPSQVDTFDYKPLLQKLHGKPVPDSIRDAVLKSPLKNVFTSCGDLMGSPYKFTQHGQSGMWVSELFPHLAERVDDLCFIHSMQAQSNNHAPASYQLHTGETVSGKPSLGSWVTYGLGSDNQNLPSYVTLFEAGPFGGAANYTNAFLPAAFQPTQLRSQGMPVLDLLPPSQFAAGQRASVDLIHQLNMKHRAARPGVGELDARIASYELAYQMQSAALEVGDIGQEPEYVRRCYGVDSTDEHTRKFASKCLLACRLVERGVRFVQVYHMHDFNGWDAHADLPKNHPDLARQCDQSIAALLHDLKQRGLFDETLVVWAGEFGRTPMMQGENGRQHNAAGFTIWMAGGGVRPGRIGATDEIGLRAVERPHGFQDLHATILAALGIDCEALTYLHQGREERLTGIPGSASLIRGALA
jgi:hypothetical protein